MLKMWMEWLFSILTRMRCYNVLSSNFGSVEPIVVPLVKVVAKRPMVWKLWLLLFMFDVLGWHIMHCAHCNNFSLFQTILAFIKWKKNWSIFYFVSQKVWVANSLILNSTILESQVHENFKIWCHFFCSIYFHFDLFWYQCVSLWQKAATFLLIDRKDSDHVEAKGCWRCTCQKLLMPLTLNFSSTSFLPTFFRGQDCSIQFVMASFFLIYLPYSI